MKCALKAGRLPEIPTAGTSNFYGKRPWRLEMLQSTQLTFKTLGIPEPV